MNDPERVYTQLGRLVQSVPNFSDYPVSTEALQWLGRVYALVEEAGSTAESAAFRKAMDSVATEAIPTRQEAAIQTVLSVTYRTLAVAEASAPTGVRGAFIPAGNSFDAMTAVAKVLGPANSSILIIDPYMDEKALTDFAALAKERVAMKLLSDSQSHKPTLRPASARWIAQYGPSRPLEVRLAPTRALHDRLIIVDDHEVWILTQSLNAFAVRSPASIVKVDDETARLKIDAYAAIWNAGTPI